MPTETYVGTITTTFEFDKDSPIIELLSDGFGDNEERKQWNGKTLADASNEEKERIFELVYRASITDPYWITFDVEIDEDTR